MARIIKPLTNTEIERAKPQNKPYTLFGSLSETAT
ncbi:phage integrase family site-specific recombinase [Avibacterium avium]|uniref:Phage integrase family site-specific recombinase n=1 Tax=Avibacterium avium TaxID=751 RepID=A0A379ARC9_AVIAV|nr:phage integrase family site-specific recombinase [Avibacterium avium]